MCIFYDSIYTVHCNAWRIQLSSAGRLTCIQKWSSMIGAYWKSTLQDCVHKEIRLEPSSKWLLWKCDTIRATWNTYVHTQTHLLNIPERGYLLTTTTTTTNHWQIVCVCVFSRMCGTCCFSSDPIWVLNKGTVSFFVFNSRDWVWTVLWKCFIKGGKAHMHVIIFR